MPAACATRNLLVAVALPDPPRRRAPRPRPHRPPRRTAPGEAGGYVRADVDAWLARALAAHRGHYRDPTAREAAASLLPPSVLAHAALLAELVRLVPGIDMDQLAFAARHHRTRSRR
ncbi:hypothetical protein [Streptomyces sp. NPDC102437]|uniref:hypothetical protein n=1 Tax=Streptomyces sp. NPDC102437 TaxID=3366175 RepID=UPI00382AEDF5